MLEDINNRRAGQGLAPVDKLTIQVGPEGCYAQHTNLLRMLRKHSPDCCHDACCLCRAFCALSWKLSAHTPARLQCSPVPFACCACVQLLKENLVGQELDGRPWAPGNKTKDILIADYRCGTCPGRCPALGPLVSLHAQGVWQSMQVSARSAASVPALPCTNCPGWISKAWLSSCTFPCYPLQARAAAV